MSPIPRRRFQTDRLTIDVSNLIYTSDFDEFFERDYCTPSPADLEDDEQESEEDE